MFEDIVDYHMSLYCWRSHLGTIGRESLLLCDPGRNDLGRAESRTMEKSENSRFIHAINKPHARKFSHFHIYTKYMLQSHPNNCHICLCWSSVIHFFVGKIQYFSVFSSVNLVNFYQNDFHTKHGGRRHANPCFLLKIAIFFSWQSTLIFFSLYHQFSS